MALCFLSFTFEKLYYLVNGDGYVPYDEQFCRWISPVGRAAAVYMWCGQPIIASVTLKTMRNEYVSPEQVKRWFWLSSGLTLYFLVMALVYSQGTSACNLPDPVTK